MRVEPSHPAPFQEAEIPAGVTSPGAATQDNVNMDSKTWSFFVVLNFFNVPLLF